LLRLGVLAQNRSDVHVRKIRSQKSHFETKSRLLTTTVKTKKKTNLVVTITIYTYQYIPYNHQYIPYKVEITGIMSSSSTSTSTSTSIPIKCSSSTGISYDVLQLQNADTSNAIIHYFETNHQFIELSEKEGTLIQIRDEEDDEKLKDGIIYAQKKGVIDLHYIPEPYIQMDVSTMTPNMVADTILQYVNNDHPISTKSNNNDNGYVIVLVGLSGTGKGTTVTQLVTKLQLQQYNVITWSNGNIFRCITLLATSYWQDQQLQQHDQESNMDSFDKDIVLTKENIQIFMNMLSFEKNPFTNQYDICINDNNGNTYQNVWVSDIQNTILKSSIVSKFIPTVAELIQVCYLVLLFNVDCYSIV
jgi:hypothetical protein